MPLSEADVREILRLIDESDVDELRVETEGFSLYVRRDETAAGEEQPPSPPDGRAADGLLTISAPMIGTFYRAEAPGAAPYVELGTRVEPDTVVCLIEVMKMMNPIPAGTGGTIVEVCAANAEPVEYGAPLFQVRPGS
jgi:biotin carboxyl carrier protein